MATIIKYYTFCMMLAIVFNFSVPVNAGFFKKFKRRIKKLQSKVQSIAKRSSYKRKTYVRKNQFVVSCQNGIKKEYCPLGIKKKGCDSSNRPFIICLTHAEHLERSSRKTKKRQEAPRKQRRMERYFRAKKMLETYQKKSKLTLAKRKKSNKPKKKNNSKPTGKPRPGAK